jgi:3-isopropylmalate/(R)-2-methylmalate dehydratase large subunit
MTLTEKILARASGRASVRPGDNIWVNADILLTHDVCGPGTIGVFHREFGRDAKVWDARKIVIIPDHYIFTAMWTPCALSCGNRACPISMM